MRMRLLVFVLCIAACTPVVSNPPSAREASPSRVDETTTSRPPATDPATLKGDYLLFNDRGRGELVVADMSGTEVMRVADAGAPITVQVAIDPARRRVAYWREARGGGFELVVWEIGNTTIRVMASESDLAPWTVPLWTTDGEAIITTVATAPSAAPPGAAPARGRLEILSVPGGTRRTLTEFAAEYPIVALFADRDVITGLRLGTTAMTYVALDANSGSLRTTADAETFRFFGAATQARMAWGLIGEFESTKPATLRVWEVADYGREVARVEVPGPGIPLAWPGRSEIAFSSFTPGGHEIRALDYASGLSRTVGVMGPGGSPLGFSGDGSALLLSRSSTISEYLLARIVADGTLGPVTPYRVTGRPDDPTFMFLGWLRV
jgi:hypothetical protein